MDLAELPVETLDVLLDDALRDEDSRQIWRLIHELERREGREELVI